MAAEEGKALERDERENGLWDTTLSLPREGDKAWGAEGWGEEEREGEEEGRGEGIFSIGVG